MNVYWKRCNRQVSRRFKEEVIIRRFLSGLFVFLLVGTLVTGVAASPASAAGLGHGGYMEAPYWFTAIDASGNLSNPVGDLFWNSIQYVVYRPGLNAVYNLVAHPNYQPDPNNQYTAQAVTVITAIQRYNPSGGLEDCTVGGTFQVPRTYVRTTAANVPYLQFNVTFTTYDAQTGAVTAIESYDPVYFDLNSVVAPPPLP
jgi:hypothetical protein